MVGLATALSIRRAGFDVMLIDPGSPDERASTATAGIVGCSAVIPWVDDGLWASLPGMLLDRNSPLQLSWRLADGLWPFYRHSRRAGREPDYSNSAAGLASLGLNGYRHWMALLDECEPARSLFSRNGCSFLYTTAAARLADQPNNLVRKQRGMALEQLDAVQTLEKIPQLAKAPCGSVNVVQAGHVADPLLLQQHLLSAFSASGGEVVQASVTDFITERNRIVGLETTAGRQAAGQYVVAAGVASAALARRLGCRVPLLAGYGSGLVLSQCNVKIDAPFLVLDQGFAVVPNRHGLRVAGLVSLGGARRKRQQAMLLRRVGQLFENLQYQSITATTGARALTPDSLPLISRAPGFSNAFFNFGHGHWGLTQAASSAALVVQLLSNDQLDQNIGRYCATRFH